MLVMRGRCHVFRPLHPAVPAASEGLSPSDRERLDDLRARFTRGEVFAEDCPSREILRHVTSRWGGLTLMALYGGTMRFSELRSKIKGVSERMLSQTLDTLEADGWSRAVPIPSFRRMWNTASPPWGWN